MAAFAVVATVAAVAAVAAFAAAALAASRVAALCVAASALLSSHEIWKNKDRQPKALLLLQWLRHVFKVGS